LLAATPLVYICKITGWRTDLFIVGSLTILIGCIIYLTLTDKDISISHKKNSIQNTVSELKIGIQTIIKMKNFWLIFIWFMFMIGNMFTLLTTWWGSYLMQANGLSKEATGLSISIMSIGPLPFLLIVPWLSDHVFHSRRLFLLLAALLESLVLLYICYHGNKQLSFTELTVAGFIIGIATTCMGPLSFTMVKESVPSPALASACGFLNCSGPIVSAILQSIFGTILAMLLEHGNTPSYAYSVAFIPLLVGSIIAFIATLFMKDTLSDTCTKEVPI
jgi:sugar phosphate permease